MRAAALLLLAAFVPGLCAQELSPPAPKQEVRRQPKQADKAYERGLKLQRAGQFLTQIADFGGIGKPSGNQAGKPRKARDREQEFLVEVRRRVTRDADVVEFGWCDAGRIEAIADRQGGKTRAMFLAIESFFFRSSDQLAIANNRSRRIPVVGIDSQNVQTHSYWLAEKLKYGLPCKKIVNAAF